ncbi:unnamed protein product [Nyctereutes procyonoides]|uniref:(raccoon dog) hypothetical protein n=1 Tax=Nyctereutes procyonoides TaxID=34880 RepID=A0A811YS88_NYCPR|nr:unnamed protein product [Nyctereutes procyonoides]
MNQSESEDPRSKSFHVQGQKKMDTPAQEQRENLLFLCHFAPFGPSVDHTSVRTDLLTQSTEPNANVFWKHPHRCTQRLHFISYLGIL